jgi:hypothetical protein
MSRRIRFAGSHFFLSVLVAGAVALLVFLVWYPSPYDSLAGGLSLFAILVGVDVALGPMLTAVVASPGKPRAELLRDVTLIAVIQLAAFSYGVYTIALARPVYIVYEVDRLRVVSAADIAPADLAKSAPEFRPLPWAGPRFIATVAPTDSAALFDSIGRSLQGTDLAMQPEHWVRYADANPAMLKAARLISVLLQRYPDAASAVGSAARTAGVPPSNLRFLPLMSRRRAGVALLSTPDMRVVGYLDVNGFF